MKIDQLKYIVEVAKTRSISLAAKNLHISQAGISKALASFEKEYDVELFRRSKNGTIPTEKGNQIISTAADLLVKVYELENELRDENRNNRSTIKISATANFFVGILSDALVKFKKNFPNVDINLFQEDAHQIFKDVIENKVDLGFASLYDEVIQESSLNFEVLLEGKLYALVSRDSHLAAYKSLTLAEVLNEPIALFDGVNMKRLAQKITEHHGHLKILVTTNNLDVIKKIIANGQAIGFSPDVSLINEPYLRDGKILSVPLIIPFNIPRYFGVISSKEKTLSAPALYFEEVVKEIIQNSQIKPK